MLDGRYFHHGYVTRDIDKAIETLSALYGITFERIANGESAMLPTKDGIAEVRCKIALGWHENLEYELIEPIGGYVDFYREAFADDHTPRLHHMGLLVSDWDRLQADIAERGYQVILSGEFDEIKFAYVDVRNQLGHYLEYMWMSDAYWAWRRQAAKLPKGVRP